MAKVFLDYDQKALDDAYDQSVYAPNRDQVLKRLAYASELVRKRLGGPQRFQYGEKPIHGLDFFKCDRDKAPINVFVHGGAWRAGLARDYAYPAEMFVRAGAHLAVLDFENVIETGGDLMPMVAQVQAGIRWICANASRVGGDPARIFVSATSSGAHLSGVAATAGLPVQGFALCSGMYDLRAPRLSKRSAYVQFTDAMEQALSPMRHIERIGAPIVLLYGSLETPEFQRQSSDFADALTRAGKPCEVIRAELCNHFEIAETLGNPYGPMGRAVLSQMKL